jgi:hypothetical protein
MIELNTFRPYLKLKRPNSTLCVPVDQIRWLWFEQDFDRYSLLWLEAEETSLRLNHIEALWLVSYWDMVSKAYLQIDRPQSQLFVPYDQIRWLELQDPYQRSALWLKKDKSPLDISPEETANVFRYWATTNTPWLQIAKLQNEAYIPCNQICKLQLRHDINQSSKIWIAEELEPLDLSSVEAFHLLHYWEQQTAIYPWDQ